MNWYDICTCWVLELADTQRISLMIYLHSIRYSVHIGQRENDEAGHLVRTEAGRLTKKAALVGTPDCMKGEDRNQVGEDCIKRDVSNAEEDDRWGEKAAKREKWKVITAGAVLQYIN